MEVAVIGKGLVEFRSAEMPSGFSMHIDKCQWTTGKTQYQLSGFRRSKSRQGLWRYERHHLTICPLDKAEADLWAKFIGEPTHQQPHKPLLIIANPCSGTKKAINILYGHLLPLLDELARPYEVLVTERPNHGLEHVRTAPDLADNFRGIVLVSGDGLVFEVVQGLFQRPDKAAGRIPIGIIPCGSGNGLASSLAFANRDLVGADAGLASALANVCSTGQVDMDMACVTLANGCVVYSFLSVGWGLFSNCDIDSEWLRFLGDVRFAVYSVWLAARLQSYRGLLSYRRAGQGLDGRTVREDGEFVCVYCLNLPWVARGCFLAPAAKFDDGLLWLLVIRKGVTRSKILKVFARLSSGRHATMTGSVDLFPVKAFRLEPKDAGTYLTVDGEVVEYGPVSVDVMPSAMKIMSK